MGLTWDGAPGAGRSGAVRLPGVRGWRSGARGPARALPRRIAAEPRCRLPADGRAVHVLADHFLELADAEFFALLAADFNEKVDDALVVPLVGSLAGASGLHRLKKVVHHVAHVSIIGDRYARLQVMRDHMLARTSRNSDSFT